jgi:hypothetical protein
VEDYKAAAGNNVAEIALVTFFPQPRGSGVIPVDRKYALSGKVYDDTFYTILHWDFIETQTLYFNILTLLGLTTVPSAPITLYTLDIRFGPRRFNGTAQLPEPTVDIGNRNFFLRDFDLLITNMVSL